MRYFTILALIGVIGYCAVSAIPNGPGGGAKPLGAPNDNPNVKETNNKSLGNMLQSLLKDAAQTLFAFLKQQLMPTKPQNDNYNCSFGLFVYGHMRKLLDSQNLVALSQQLNLSTTGPGVNSTTIQRAGFAGVFQRLIAANPPLALFLMSCEAQVDLAFGQWIVSRGIMPAPTMTTNMTMPSLTCPLKMGRNESISFTLNNQTWSLSWSANMSNGSSTRGSVNLGPVRDALDSSIRVIFNDTALVAFAEKYWLPPSCPTAFFDLIEIIKRQFFAGPGMMPQGPNRPPQGPPQGGPGSGPQPGRPSNI